MKLIVKVIFKAVKSLINLILLPIDLIVKTAFPSTTTIISSVGTFFDTIGTGILWVKSWLPFDTYFYTVLVSVLVFKYTIPFTVHTIKLVVAWYNKLKP